MKQRLQLLQQFESLVPVFKIYMKKEKIIERINRIIDLRHFAWSKGVSDRAEIREFERRDTKLACELVDLRKKLNSANLERAK